MTKAGLRRALSLLFLLGILCGCYPSVSHPAPQSDAAPLFEYCFEEEKWSPISLNEVQYVCSQSVLIRRTLYGKAFGFKVQGDGGSPGFSGKVTTEEGGLVRVEGKGGIIIASKTPAGKEEKYAKIVLQCPE